MARARKKTASKSPKSRKTQSKRVSAAKKPVTKPGKLVAKPRRVRIQKKAAPKKKAVRRSPLRRIPIQARFFSKSNLPSAYEVKPHSTPETLKPALEVDRRLPHGYGVNKLTLLVRDPWWIFSYWEVTRERSEEVIARMPWGDRDARVTVLRVYDLTGASYEKPASFFDIELRIAADSWYIDVGGPNKQWGAELGYRLPDGRFWALVRSNVVLTPRFGFSDVLDEEWMIPDEEFWRLAGAYGPDDFGRTSSDVRRRPGERFLRTLSSDGSARLSLKNPAPATGAR